MPHKQTRMVRPFRGWWLVIFALLSLTTLRLSAADILLPSLKIGTDVFTNVTVYQMTATDIFVRHGRGFGNAKISNLDDSTLVLLGLKSPKATATAGTVDPTDPMGTNAPMAAAVDKLKTALADRDVKLSPEAVAALEIISHFKPKARLLYGVLGGLILGYLFMCLCFQKICVNAGSNPGALVWLPILQIFPLLRAARIPAWWFVISFIPVLNILLHILWSIRIVKACGKGGLVTLLLLLPVTNVLAILYLAFSGGNEHREERVMKAEDLPGLAGA